jgi:hypothetical protein
VLSVSCGFLILSLSLLENLCCWQKHAWAVGEEKAEARTVSFDEDAVPGSLVALITLVPNAKMAREGIRIRKPGIILREYRISLLSRKAEFVAVNFFDEKMAINTRVFAVHSHAPPQTMTRKTVESLSYSI